MYMHVYMHTWQAAIEQIRQANRQQKGETWPMRIMYERSAISFFTSLIS